MRNFMIWLLEIVSSICIRKSSFLSCEWALGEGKRCLLLPSMLLVSWEKPAQSSEIASSYSSKHQNRIIEYSPIFEIMIWIFNNMRYLKDFLMYASLE